MAAPESTCWTVIEAAAAGSPGDRNAFARRYAPVVQTYLSSRWRTTPYLSELEDAVQEVFVECFKQGGVLDRAERDRPGGFRAFLYGVVRNVALRVEAGRTRGREQQLPSSLDLDQVQASEADLSRLFDRAWARVLLREAAQRQQERAQSAALLKDPVQAAVRRVELLRLRFHEGLPIRDIAQRWGVEPAHLHHEYARARQEFRAALREVVAFHHPGPPAAVEEECANLLALLG
jgi:RNA polymerase sigma-70 factor (ECF subfamily)